MNFSARRYFGTWNYACLLILVRLPFHIYRMKTETMLQLQFNWTPAQAKATKFLFPTCASRQFCHLGLSLVHTNPGSHTLSADRTFFQLKMCSFVYVLTQLMKQGTQESIFWSLQLLCTNPSQYRDGIFCCRGLLL